jgi:hypothetical protein
MHRLRPGIRPGVGRGFGRSLRECGKVVGTL